MANPESMRNSSIEFDEKHLKKLKNRALASFSRTDRARDAIRNEAYCIDFYHEDRFKEMLESAQTHEDKELIEVLIERYHASSKLETVLDRKSRLVRLKKEKEEKGQSLLPDQEAALQEATNNVGILSSKLSALPPVGVTRKEHDGQRPSGRQPLQMEQELIRFKKAMDISFDELNKYEKVFGLETSTARSLQAERDSFQRNGGRNQLRERVAIVEEIDRNLRRAEEEHERTLAKPDSAFAPKKFGKNPLPKNERLKLQAQEIKSLRAKLQQAESTLKGEDLLERKKKIIERAKRASKGAGDMVAYEAHSETFEKLKAIEFGIRDIKKAGASNSAVEDFVDSSLAKLNSVDPNDLKKVDAFVDSEVQEESAPAMTQVNEDVIDDAINDVLASFEI